MNKKHLLQLGLFMLLSAIIVGCSSDLSSKSDESSGLIGRWELTTVSPRGTRTRTLTINEDLTGTYQGRNREIPITDLKVEGDQVSFKIQMKFREREFTMEFKGTLDGTSLKGRWVTARGSRDVTGKKVSTTP